MRLTVDDVLAATGGSLVAGTAERLIESVAMDSRTLGQGGMFVALAGTRDGHDFAGDAVRRGATAVLVERNVEVPVSTAVIRVGDTRAALAALARFARTRLESVRVIGITGSTGKTSTKDLATGALQRWRVHASARSFNNELGVPLTLLAAPESTEVVIVEMGARAVGDIAYLCELARPEIGVVTNTGLAHVGELGSPEEVARAKGELIEALPAHGTAVLNADDASTPALAARSSADVITFGVESPLADVRARRLSIDEGLSPRFVLESPWGSAEVELQARGRHQVVNAVAAAAAAGVGGAPLEHIVEGLAAARLSGGRLSIEDAPGGVVVLDDTYNANPASMLAALEALAAYPARGARWAVLGEMAELGSYAREQHRLVGEHVIRLGIQRLVVIGPRAAEIGAGARAANAHDACEIVQTSGAADTSALLASGVRPGDVVLVKGSRVARLERVTAALVGRTPA